jgi:hypothetical protein
MLQNSQQADGIEFPAGEHGGRKHGRKA